MLLRRPSLSDRERRIHLHQSQPALKHMTAPPPLTHQKLLHARTEIFRNVRVTKVYSCLRATENLVWQVGVKGVGQEGIGTKSN